MKMDPKIVRKLAAWSARIYYAQPYGTLRRRLAMRVHMVFRDMDTGPIRPRR